MFGFVVIHMLGNLQIFVDRETINHYAWLLKLSPEVLWLFRLALLAFLVAHAGAAIELTRRNRAAKPVGNAVAHANGASPAALTMMVTGLLVLAFIVFHILHFTTFTIYPAYAQMVYEAGFGERHDVYRMVATAFQKPWLVGLYVAGMALVGFHLSHGISSMFRSLGFTNEVWRRPQEIFAMAAASVIFVGMSSVPVGCFVGLRPITEIPGGQSALPQPVSGQPPSHFQPRQASYGYGK